MEWRITGRKKEEENVTDNGTHRKALHLPATFLITSIDVDLINENFLTEYKEKNMKKMKREREKSDRAEREKREIERR